MMATSGFAVWFLKLFKNKKTAISCPESTVLVKRTMRASSQHREWLDLAKHEQVTKRKLRAFYKKSNKCCKNGEQPRSPENVKLFYVKRDEFTYP